MGRVLTFEIPDEIYSALEEMAAKAGVRTEVCVLEYLSRQAAVRRRPRSEEESREAERRFEQYIGSVDLGRPTGTDNEGIDRDLAREYGDAHESGA